MRRVLLIILLVLVVLGSVFYAPWSSSVAQNRATRKAAPPIAPVPQSTSAKWALIIGNNNYKVCPLRNPVNDASALAKVLGQFGFKVILKKNADLATMEDSLEEFGKNLRKGGVGLFFYAGHGVQVSNTNYLIPVDANIKKDRDVKRVALDVEKVLDEMADAKNNINIVILDACRDNPFPKSSRSAFKGLAGIDAPEGTIVAFSTSPGKVADDGPGKNSPYTAALIESIKKPGLPIEQVFKAVRQKVKESTNNNQIPWESTSLTGDFYFNPEVKEGEEKKSQADEEKRVEAERQKAEKGKIGAEAQKQREDKKHNVAQEKRDRAAWSKKLGAMKAAFRKVEKIDKQKGTPEKKIEAWQQFLSIYEEKNPYTEEDSKLREKAEKRVEYWQNARNVKEGKNKPENKKTEGEPKEYRDALTGMEFVLVPEGSFIMGSPAEEVGRWEKDDREGPQHRVEITRPFYLGKHEVTVGQFLKFVQDTGYKTEAENGGGAFTWVNGKWEKTEGIYWDNPGFPQSKSHPVTCVSWNDAHAFIRWLNRKSGRTYRLPTEAEWEYAARARTTTARFWGNDLNRTCEYANVADQTRSPEGKTWEDRFECKDDYWFTAPVGSYQPNGFNLYDMLGNVWEWCEDWFDAKYYKKSPTQDPLGPSIGSERIVRGGGWRNLPRYVRSANRGSSLPDYRSYGLGFRIAESR
jgi:formylglycine-generating enzyme required for sulfatase activity